MNKKILIAICCAVMVMIIIVYGMILKSNNKNEEITEEAIAENIIIKEKLVKYENSKQQINTVIPEIQNLDAEYVRYFNSKMYDEISAENVYKTSIEGYQEEEIGFFTYEAKYNRYNSNDYISIVIDQYIHLGDGRPKLQKKCYVIDAKRSVTPTLMDVFENKVNYKKAIINEINKQATQSNIELIGGNGLKELGDLQAFYIKDGKLVIYFEASEIAATAVGELEFVMPFEMVNGRFVL